MEVKEGKRFERHSICVWVRARTLDKHALNLLDPEFEHVHFLKLIWRGWVFVFLLPYHTIVLYSHLDSICSQHNIDGSSQPAFEFNMSRDRGRRFYDVAIEPSASAFLQASSQRSAVPTHLAVVNPKLQLSNNLFPATLLSTSTSSQTRPMTARRAPSTNQVQAVAPLPTGNLSWNRTKWTTAPMPAPHRCQQ